MSGHQAEVIREVTHKTVLEFEADNDKAADIIADDYVKCLVVGKPLVGLLDSPPTWELDNEDYDLEDMWSEPDDDDDSQDNHPDNIADDFGEEDDDDADDIDGEDDRMIL